MTFAGAMTILNKEMEFMGKNFNEVLEFIGRNPMAVPYKVREAYEAYNMFMEDSRDL
jgi:hypothetical protein